MLSGLMNFLNACLWPRSDQQARSPSDSGGRQEGLLWYRDSGQHVFGDFSMAVVQANSLLEDQSQLESGSLSSHDSGPYGTFVGVYDGHGGPETSRFINDHMFHQLKSESLCSLNLYIYICFFNSKASLRKEIKPLSSTSTSPENGFSFDLIFVFCAQGLLQSNSVCRQR